MMQELGMAADYSLQLCLGPIDPPATSSPPCTDKHILIGSSKSREDENPNPDNLLLPQHLHHVHAALLHHQSPAITMSYAGNRRNSSFNGVFGSYGDNVGCDQETNHPWISATAAPAVFNPNFAMPSSALLLNSVPMEASSSVNCPTKASEIAKFSIKTSTGLNNSAVTASENPADSAHIAYANPKLDVESFPNENAAITASGNPKDVFSKASTGPDHFAMKDSSNDNSFITTIMSANANPSCAASENPTCAAKVKICAKPNPTSTSSENHNSFVKATPANPNVSTAIDASATTSSLPSNLSAKSVKFEIPATNTSVTRASSHSSSSCFPSGSAMAEDRSSRLGPVWIASFVNCQSYFSKCQVHVNQSEENRLEKNQFCIDCVGGPICPRGLKRDHDGHRTLQVRRASKSNAIKAADIQEHVDITGIQQYTINNAKIVFLCKRPSSTASLSKDSQALHGHSHSHSHSHDHPRQRSFQDYIISSPNSKACHAPKASFDQASKVSCLACGRTLPDSMKFCSLQCKLESIAKNIDDQHVRYSTTSNRVSSLSSLSLSLQPSSANPNSSSSSAAAFEYDRYGASSSSNSNHFQSIYPKEISCAAGSIDDMKPALFPLRKRRPSSCPPPPRYIKNSSCTNDISGSACKLNCHIQKLRASAAAVHSQVKSISPDKEEGDEEDVDGNVMVRSTSYSAEPAMGANHAVGSRKKKRINTTIRSLEAQVISGRCSNPQHDLSSSNLLMQTSVGVPRSDCELPMESRARLRKSTARSSSSNAQEMRMMINASSDAELSIKAEQCKDCAYSNQHSLSPNAISISIRAASTDDHHRDHDLRTGSNSTCYLPAISSQYSNHIHHHHHVKKRLHKRKGFPRRSPFQ